MSKLIGLLTVGGSGILMQTEGCDTQTLNSLMAESISQLISGVIAAIISQFVNGLFNLPPTFDLSSFL